ncbi:MAG: hypothetical protein WCP12_12215 [bacterium]
MKNMLIRLGLLACIVCLSGCATVKTARNFDGLRVDGGAKPVATVAIENYGYYLFGLIPLIAGEPRYPNAPLCSLFNDTVTTQNNMLMLSKTAQKYGGKKVAHLRVYEHWTGSFSLWVIWQKQLFTGAVLTE